MPIPARSQAAIGFTALLLSVAPLAAHATDLVTNGSFEQYDGTAPKGTFTNVLPTGWSGGANLTFVDAPGTADDGTYMSVYGPFPTTSPDGGNFIEADGDPNYSGALYQTISGLTVGQAYTVSFYQAAGQQVGFTGTTTEQWGVTFGGVTQYSAMYSLPQAGVGPWEQQTMTFIANSTSQILSFLANGTPGGAPPISFLDGVSLQVAVPEPASFSLLAAGLIGLGALGRRWRIRRAG